MDRIISINERGTITLPKDLRKKYGLEAGGQVIIEESESGLILRPGVTFSVEIYSDTRVKEFKQQNDAELEGFEL
jgi:AbrB family looped-hinge helix DNA binding protein